MAILGAHNLGRANPDETGFSGAWVPGQETTFNTSFYQLMIANNLTYKNVVLYTFIRNDASIFQTRTFLQNILGQHLTLFIPSSFFNPRQAWNFLLYSVNNFKFIITVLNKNSCNGHVL